MRIAISSRAGEGKGKGKGKRGEQEQRVQEIKIPHRPALPTASD
jgi:hypothetical protein